MPFRKIDDGSQTDDTEGNRKYLGRLDDGSQDEDAEGHGRTPGRLEDGSQDEDAEGHGPWSGGKRIQPTKAVMSDADIGDIHGGSTRIPPLAGDAEGHSLPNSALEREGRGGGQARRGESDTDDVEGHVNWRPLDRGSDH